MKPSNGVNIDQSSVEEDKKEKHQNTEIMVAAVLNEDSGGEGQSPSSAVSQDVSPEYWKAFLSSLESSPFPSIPSTISIPKLGSTLARTFPLPLSPSFATEVSPSSLLLAAWILIVGKITYSKDVTFALKTAENYGKSGSKTQTLPMRAKLEDEQDIAEFLDRIHRDASNRNQVQGIEINEVMTKPEYASMFQTLFIIHPKNQHTSGRNTAPSNDHKYALVIEIQLNASTVTVNAAFDARIMHSETTKKLLERLNFVALQFHDVAPASKISDILILTEQDLEAVWQGNVSPPTPVEGYIHEAFEQMAVSQPSAPAICAWDGNLSYSELDTLATQLSIQLLKKGVAQGVIVPLYFEKSMWTAVAILGTLKAGGAFVLLDVALPHQRLRDIVQQIGAKILLSSARNKDQASSLTENVQVVDKHIFEGHAAQEKKLKRVAGLNPISTAFVTFTSGSTGVQKGVIVSHGNVASAFLRPGNPIYQCTSHSRVYDFASYSFTIAITNLFMSFAVGGCLCIPSEEERKADLASSFMSLGANTVILTPSIAAILKPEKIKGIEVLILVGEPVRSKDMERWRGHARTMIAYGNSECTAAVTINYPSSSAHGLDSIGKAFASAIWVVDPENHDRLLPPGCIGELLVEGPMVSPGYLHDPIKTATAFIDAPGWLIRGSSIAPGRKARLNKTGDLVRQEEDGSLYYFGRKDTQVKIRGQRVELNEVEYWVQHYVQNAIDTVAEIIKPQGAGSKPTLAAFILMEDQPFPERAENCSAHVLSIPKDVQEHLAEHLPVHMMPSVYFSVSHLPTMPSGKINRREIRQIGASFTVEKLAELRTSTTGSKEKCFPTSQQQLDMQELWAKVLCLDRQIIGLHDSFFSLGGDSITAMKLVGEVRRMGWGDITVADVFHNAQLHQLTEYISVCSGGIPNPIQPLAYTGPVEQSFAQGRLWFLEELYAGLNWYNLPFAVRIKGSLDLKALELAFHSLEKRHEALRTVFFTKNGIGYQEIQSFTRKPLKIVDIDETDMTLAEALRQDRTLRFDLQTEVGWRYSVYRISKNEHVLSIVQHHIVSDGWSMELLARELSQFYSIALRSQDPLAETPPLPVQYRDFSVWQRDREQIDASRKQLSYWVEQLQTSRPAEFLCDKIRPATLSGKAGIHSFVIGAKVYGQLQGFCKAQDVTVFTALLAIFRAMHYRLTGQDDATLGAPNANRDRWEVQDVIGFFVNVQCLRIKASDSQTFKELVHQVHELVVASLANQDVPFDSIVSELRRDRDLSRHPICQIMFAVHSQMGLGKFDLEGVHVETIDTPMNSRLDLEFHVFREPHQLRGEIWFSEDLFEPETITCMVDIFQGLLGQCLAKPDTKIATAPLLTQATRSQLDRVGIFNSNKTTYPRDSSVISVFRQQAASFPTRIAVQDSSTEISYYRLDMLSNRLASFLSSYSFPPETLVGVLANRSCQAIVALLGILKAGFAYLPFDAKVTSSRMTTILSSVKGPKLVLVGDGIQPHKPDLDDVIFASIAEALSRSTSDAFTPKPGFLPSATSLAYVMFTSGSTGQPKGVMIEHRGIVRLATGNSIMQLLPSTGAMAHMVNFAFDAATMEIYAALLNGMTLVCVGAMQILDHAVTLDLFTRFDVRAAVLTPALFRQYDIECTKILAKLSWLCVGGDKINPVHLFEARKSFKGTFINGYGPTENTTASTAFILSDDEKCVNGVPIGSAYSNSGAYVMDLEQNLVPLGVIGELVVTGDGLARGYTDAKRNTDRFIKVKIENKTMRAYRTGDYVRNRPVDGQIEFFGRIDGQVKIRGHRVEVGEVEAILSSHKSVQGAVVVKQEIEDDGAQLAGYITLHEETGIADGQNIDKGHLKYVNAWEHHFEHETYGALDHVERKDTGRDFMGWTSMYDDSEIDKGEMNEWLDDTLDTLHNGSSPGHVLEIGSGSGMILFNLNKGLMSYVGCDPSQSAVEYITKRAHSIPTLANKVRAYKATAMDIDRIDQLGSPSLAVINSVAQYFPSLEYALQVLQKLLAIGSIETVFFGDIRSYALHREFLATRALRTAGSSADVETLREVVDEMESAELELLIDPGFFSALPDRFPDRIQHVEILPKRMNATNELSCYRYSAVIHTISQSGKELEISDVQPERWMDFEKKGLNHDSLLHQLKESIATGPVAIGNIPHSKTIFGRNLLAALDSEKGQQQDWLSSVYQRANTTAAMSAVDLAEIANQVGCRVELSWNRQFSQQGGIDAIFHTKNSRNASSRYMFRFPTDHEDRPWNSLSSQPLRKKSMRTVKKQVDRLMRAQLPQYMIPQTLEILDEFPINENGKVDRKALAQRQQKRKKIGRTPNRQKPSTDTEENMLQLWSEALRISRQDISPDDSFFRLGGDSIAAMRLVAAARKKGISLAVADVFQTPVLSDMASASAVSDSDTKNIPAFSLVPPGADTMRVREEAASACNIDESVIEDIYPCSPLQEGLIGLTYKWPGSYILRSVLEIKTEIDRERFIAAWEKVVESTAALRTRIMYSKEVGLLQVVLSQGIQWKLREDLDSYLEEDSSNPMDLGKPLVRFAMVTNAAQGKSYFVWTIHHAMYDGWSMPRILDAVATAYNGDSLPPQLNPNHFAQYLSRVDQDAAAVYWQAALADCEAVSFPSMPAARQDDCTELEIEKRHTTFTRASFSFFDATTSNLIRATWAIIASHYTNSDDVVFGVTVTGRNAPVANIDSMLGPAITTVPVRVRIDSDQKVVDFLDAIQQQATDMIPFEQTGLQRIAKISSAARHACAFQTLLVVHSGNFETVENGPLGRFQFPVTLKSYNTYGLTLDCTQDDKGIEIAATYDPNAIEKWLVQRILGHMISVLQELAQAGPSTKLSDIGALTPEETDEIWGWNAHVPSTVDRCLHDVISERALAFPDSAAICAWDGELTYSTFETLSSRLAHRLVSANIKPGMLVPLLFEKSMWTNVAICGLLKAGGAFVLLDPSLPEERLRAIVKQINPELIVTSASNQPRVAGLCAKSIVVGPESCPAHDTATTLPAVSPTSLAYITFTSGSTGTPKGVMISHRNLASAVYHQSAKLGFEPRSRVYDFASYAFDTSIENIFATFATGGCLCVPSDEDRKDQLASSISSLRADFIELTPSVGKVLDPSKVPGLKKIVFGGERLRSKDIAPWMNKVKILNTYGPSECTPTSTIYEVTSQTGETSHIGKSVGLVSWIVDPENHNILLPPGYVGELLLEGPLVGKGYLQNPGATAKAIIEDPPWLINGSRGVPGRRGRLYKTGDLVKYTNGGNLIFVGRKDRQVKIRGQRVEFGDIEYHISECLQTAGEVIAEVIAPGGGLSGTELCAFVVQNGRKETNPNAQENDTATLMQIPPKTLELLGERLPVYMVPTLFLEIQKVPMTVSAKVDRRRLEEIASSFYIQRSDDKQATKWTKNRVPHTEIEKTIQSLWAQVLDIEADTIGLDDSFFGLGGDSITAMQVTSSARSLQLIISTHDILKEKTISKVARLAKSSSPSSSVTVRQNKTNEAFVLGPMQQLYLKLEPTGQCNFDQSFLFDLSTNVDFLSLKPALEALVQRHPMLRARFQKGANGKWHQSISNHVESSFSIEAVGEYDGPQMAQSIRSSRERLNITDGPLLGAVLFGQGERQSLFMTIHHLVIDLISWRVLLEELESLLLGRELPAPPSIDFFTWINLQKEYTLKRTQSKTLAHYEAIDTPLEYWGLPPGPKSTITENLEIDKATTSAILKQCNEAFQTRPQELMIAALLYSFVTVFHDRKPPVLFNETHGREVWDNDIDISRTVGWFTSMHPVQLTGGGTNSNILDFVRETKDLLRSIENDTQSYFSSHLLDEHTAEKFRLLFPVELIFNYQGQYQQLERDDSLFKFSIPPKESTPASAINATLFSMFEVSMGIQDGRTHVLFEHCVGTQHDERIHTWVLEFISTLEEMPALLCARKSEWTLHDFPHVFDSYAALDRFQNLTLRKADIKPGDVEDIFPCTAMQHEFLKVQIQDRGAYWLRPIFEVTSKRHAPVDVWDRLRRAWSQVVAQHSSLRTTFLQTDTGFVNVVLKNPTPSVSIIKSDKDDVDLELFHSSHDPSNHAPGTVQHHLTMCSLENGRLYICLNIQHAIIDAHSMHIVFGHLRAVYNGTAEPHCPPFKNVVSHLLAQSQDESKQYWLRYMEGVGPCHFPSLAHSDNDVAGREISLSVKGLNSDTVNAFSRQWDVSVPVIIQTAWHLVLSLYTGSMTTCFGNYSSGRDLPIDGVGNVVGPLLTLYVSRLHIKKDQTVKQALASVQDGYLSSMPHQYFPMEKLNHALGLGKSSLFNTALTILRERGTNAVVDQDISFEHRGGLQPTDVSAYCEMRMIVDAKH